MEQRGDELAAIAGIHALSAVPGPAATSGLTDALDDGRWFVTEHAAWALSARPPHPPAMGRLAAIVADGGFRAMLAQRTLAGWAGGDAPGVLDALLGALRTADGPARARLVDTAGTVPGVAATALLESAASDDVTAVRLAAIGALGWRRGDPALLSRLAMIDDPVGQAALLALVDRTLADRPATSRGDGRTGRRIAQVVFHADLTSGRDRAGIGDNGGLATLVRQLSDAFAARDDVAQITTITRGRTADAIADLAGGLDGRQRMAAVPLGGDADVDRRSGWAHRIAVERGIRRVLLAGPRPDVIHLRMADVGTLAAERVSRHLGIPVVFTAAPDPHIVLEQLETTAELTRRNFGDADELEHWWFRARMVERLTSRADHLVLLPRRGATDQLRRVFGATAADALDRATVVPEGVDPAPISRARAALHVAARGGPTPPLLEPLRTAIEQLTVERRGLPLTVSVGRLHPTKGMDRLARAWVGSAELRAATNLLIVGGGLEQPTADELGVLGDLDDILGDAEQRRHTGAVLLGHQPNEVVAHVLAAAATGLPGFVAPGGVYVAAAAKEEFGLAIVEALGAGLAVVAPDVGGPATYIVDGVTGVLTDTRSVARLRAAIIGARQLVDRPGRVDQATDLVRSRLTIDAMAAALVDVYDTVGVTVS